VIKDFDFFEHYRSCLSKEEDDLISIFENSRGYSQPRAFAKRLFDALHESVEVFVFG